MRWLTRGFLAANIVVAWLFLWYVASKGFTKSDTYTSAELVSIALTALTVILAALPIFLGLIAVWGYASLRDVARETARKAAEEVAKATAEEIAGRTAREMVDQEAGQADGNEYARGAATEDGSHRGPDGR